MVRKYVGICFLLIILGGILWDLIANNQTRPPLFISIEIIIVIFSIWSLYKSFTMRVPK
jgi:hypothetical protein